MTRKNYFTDGHIDLDCPICKEIMVNPVVASDNKWYDEACILKWFSLGNNTSPITGATLEDLTLTPVHQIYDALQARYTDEDRKRQKDQQKELEQLLTPIQKQFQDQLQRLKAIAAKEKITFNPQALLRENMDKAKLFLQFIDSVEKLCAVDSIFIRDLWSLKEDHLKVIFARPSKTADLVEKAGIPLKSLFNYSNYIVLIRFAKHLVQLKQENGITLADFWSLPNDVRDALFTRLDIVALLICDYQVQWKSLITIKENKKYDIIFSFPNNFKNIIDQMAGATWEAIFEAGAELLNELRAFTSKIQTLSQHCALTWQYYASLEKGDREFLCQHSTKIELLVSENGFTLKSLIELAQKDRDWVIKHYIRLATILDKKFINAEKIMQLSLDSRNKLLTQYGNYLQVKEKIDIETYFSLSEAEQQIIHDIIVYEEKLSTENRELVLSKIDNYHTISDFIDLESLIKLPFEVQKVLLENTEKLRAAYQKGIPLLNYLKTFRSDVLTRLINYVVNNEQDMLYLQSVGISLDELAYLNESSWAYFQANNLKIIDFIHEKKASNLSESSIISLNEIIDTLQERESVQWTPHFIQTPQQKAPERSSAETRVRIVRLPPPPLFSSRQKNLFAAATTSSLVGGGLWIALATGTLKMHALGSSSLALHFMSAALPVAIGITAVSVGALIGVGLYAGVKRHNENLEPRIQFQRVICDN